MAWTDLATTLANTNDKTATNPWAPVTLAALNSGEFAAILVVTDNLTGTNGTTTDHTGLTVGGQAATKLAEFTSAGGAALGGECLSWWGLVAGSTIASGATISAAFSAAITAKAIIARSFSLAAGSTVSVAGTPQTEATEAADAGSLTISGLTSGEYLWLRGVGIERPDTTALTPTAGFTAFTASSAQTIGGSAASNVLARAEFRIFTGTSLASDPNTGIASNTGGSLYIALLEIAAPAGATSPPFPMTVPPLALLGM